MIDPRLRLRHLNCFLEAARLGSLSAAAASLNVSQPAASKTIRELEDILGAALFDRSGRRLVLSAAGRLLQQHGGAAMIELRRAANLVRDTPSDRTRLAVGALPTAATRLLPEAALAFQAGHPNCTLRVSTGPNWLLMSQLREGALDLVVGRMGAAEVMADLSFVPLYAEEIVLVVRPGHPLTEAEDLAPLADYPLILPPPGAVISPQVRAFLAGAGLAGHSAGIETVSLAFGRRLVARSDAVWFISRGVVQDEICAGLLVPLRHAAPMLGGPVGVSLRASGAQSPEQSALMAALMQVAGNAGSPG